MQRNPGDRTISDNLFTYVVGPAKFISHCQRLHWASRWPEGPAAAGAGCSRPRIIRRGSYRRSLLSANSDPCGDRPSDGQCLVRWLGAESASAVVRASSTSSVRDAGSKPYDKLKSLPNAAGFLKPGITFQTLHALSYAISDNDAARALNQARKQLFHSISKTQRNAA